MGRAYRWRSGGSFEGSLSQAGFANECSGTLQSVRSLRGNVATMPKAPFRRRGRNTVHMSSITEEPLVETMDYLTGRTSVSDAQPACQVRYRCRATPAWGHRLCSVRGHASRRDRPDSSRDSRLGRSSRWWRPANRIPHGSRRATATGRNRGGRRGAQCCQVDHAPA